MDNQRLCFCLSVFCCAFYSRMSVLLKFLKFFFKFFSRYKKCFFLHFFHFRFNNLKLQRAEKRKQSSNDTSSSSKVTRLSSSGASVTKNTSCFFCDQSSPPLHQVSTFILDKRVRQCALELQDTVLLAKLSAGDLISQEAVYHNKCLVSLYNKATRAKSSTSTKNNDDRVISGIALAELISYIEDLRASGNLSVLKLADLTKLYTKRLELLGLKLSGRVHSTDLKNRILSNLPDLQAYKKGRDTFLAFDEEIGSVLKIVSKKDSDDEAVILSQAAKIVRRDMAEIKHVFDGKFPTSCQKEAVPESLLCLVSMVLRGSNIKTNSDGASLTQDSLTISQLLQYNCTLRRKDKQQTTQSHTRTRQPPLPIYVGLLVHAKTRMKGLVEKLSDLGLSIPYSRVLEISTNLGNHMISQFSEDEIVCPANMKYNIFTTAAVDNIDHNPSSATAVDSLHGTAISLFQHPSSEQEGEPRQFTTEYNAIKNEKKLLSLPETYANVPPVILPKNDPALPDNYKDIPSNSSLISEEMEKEKRFFCFIDLNFLL